VLWEDFHLQQAIEPLCLLVHFPLEEASENVEKAKEVDEQLRRAEIRQSRPEDDEVIEPTEEEKYNLRTAFQYYASDLDDHRANYYLGEANWNVRQALKLYREDARWEKQNQLCKLVPGLNPQQAWEILELCDNNVMRAVKYCKSKSMICNVEEKREGFLTTDPRIPSPEKESSPSSKCGWRFYFVCA